MILGRTGYYIRKNKRLFFASIIATVIGLAVILLLFIKATKAESLPDDTRVYENDLLTYYITVNGDGIDYEGTVSADDQMSKEYSGTTSVTDVLPDGLTFEGFVTTDDGTFGAVSREDETTQCSGHVIDDTNEESVADGVWNADETEYTYHGLHYNASTRTVSFRTKAITGGCKLTIGVKTRVPYLGKYEYRRDFYNTASFVDESIIDKSNTVHAYIQKNRPVVVESKKTEPEETWYYSLDYRYDGDIPDSAPDLPDQVWMSGGTSFTLMDAPDIECYDFDGWWWTHPSSPVGTKIPPSSLNGQMQYFNVTFWGIFTYTCGDGTDPSEGPQIDTTQYDVTYEIEGEKPDSFIVPKQRSYYAGASVDIDPTAENENIDGYSFSGWDSSDIDVDQMQTFMMPAQNVTLRGNFEREQYTVSYEYEGDVIPSGANALLPETQSYYAGDEVTTASNPSIDGYEFSGWIADSTFEMPAQNVVIRGFWTRIQTEFRPEISIKITNPQDLYHKGDRVKFETTISNTQNVNIQDLYVEELLDGAVFTSGDGYSVVDDRFAKVSSLLANGSIKLYSEIKLPLNISKVWTNTVELIAFETADDSYKLAEDFDGKASVDFESEYIEGLPEDYDPERVDPEPTPEEKSNPKTFDGSSKYIVSCIIIGITIVAIVVIIKKNRRGFAKYTKVAVVAFASLAIITIYNGGFSFADGLTEKDSIDIDSVETSYSANEGGAWRVSENAYWSDVATAQVVYNVTTKASPDFHEKDVILVLDNSNWTGNSIDGTPIDHPTDPTALDEMKREACEYVDKLLVDGDSTITVLSVWGNETPTKTSDPEQAKEIINSFYTTGNTNWNSYETSYRKVGNLLDSFEHTEGYELRIMFVLDDHDAKSSDIATYRWLKEKANGAAIFGIGYGDKEIRNERFTSWADAAEYGVLRLWRGDNGNASAISEYRWSDKGTNLISDYHSEPYHDELDATLFGITGRNITFDKFELTADINTDEFDIDSFGMSVGSVSKEDGRLVWTIDESLITGTENNNLVVRLVAKDTALAKHKLYQLTNGTKVESDSRDTAAENVQNNEKLVLMNGYEISYDMNNTGVCTAGNNDTTVVWAMQLIRPDEDGISCEGWNFDGFMDEEGVKYTQDKPNRMPARDVDLKATWRKTDVEIHMDGTVYVIAPAVLAPGKTVSTKLVKIDGSSIPSTNILLKADECPDYAIAENYRISDDDSPTPIYAYIVRNSSFVYEHYDDPTRTYYYRDPTYYCTEADKIVLNEDSSELFAGNTRYAYYDEDVANWDATNAKSLKSLLYGKYTERNTNVIKRISDWDVSNVEDMSEMFKWYIVPSGYNTEHLLENWNTSNVKNMASMFESSEYVTNNLPAIADWDTSKVTDMSGLFKYVKSADYTAISGWDTKNVESLKQAFSGSSFKDLNVIKNWDVRKVKDMSGMLSDFGQRAGYSHSATEPASLAGLENWHTDSLENMANFLSGAAVSDLTPISGWDVSKVKSMAGFFGGIDFLTDLSPIGDWHTDSLEDMHSMFYDEDPITSLDGLEGWNTHNVKDMSDMFYGAKVTDISAMGSWDVASLENLGETFAYTDITDINALSSWTTPSLNNLYRTFRYAQNLTDISGLANWNVSAVKSMESMLERTAVTSLQPMANWTTTSLEDMTYIFYMHKNITSLDGLEGWDTSKVQRMSGAFNGYYATPSGSNTDASLYCNSSLTDISAVEDWDVTNVDRMTSIFACNDKLTSLSDLHDWEPRKAEEIGGAFAGDKALTNLTGIEKWGDKAYKDMDVYQGRYNLNDMFVNCSELVDISALSNWNVKVIYINSAFRNDRKITDLTPLNNLEIKAGSIQKNNTFDNIPSSVDRPDWY